MSVVDQAVISPPSATVPHISWVHPPGGFAGLSVLNGVLRILTLGVYHFWGKTEVRQRIWSAVRINGEPLEYRGTGGELLRGFLVVFFLILLPMLLVGFGTTLLGQAAYQTSSAALWFVVLMLSGIGIHRARRYRLSRTRWRGIRGGLTGSSGRFAWTYLWTMLLIPFTLGWIVPWRTVRLQRALMEDTRFGDKAFTFTANAGPLYKRFFLLWLGTLLLVIATVAAISGVAYLGLEQPPPASPQAMPVVKPQNVAAMIGIAFVALLIFAMLRGWYSARVLNYFASETKLEGAGFALNATAPSLVWLVASNYLIRILSLGFLSAVTEARSMRYIVDRLSCEGAIAFGAIGQNPDALLTRGEGLAEAFNVDAF
jgi:uncharacterized membrane protein YjgN (DUF898 family)